MSPWVHLLRSLVVHSVEWVQFKIPFWLADLTARMSETMDPGELENNQTAVGSHLTRGPHCPPQEGYGGLQQICQAIQEL